MSEKKKGDGLRAFLPILGLLLLIAIAAISYVLTPLVYEPLNRALNLPENSELLVGGALFLGILMLVSLVYALFAPKPEKMVNERQLAKEREEKLKYDLASRKRKRQLNLKKAKENQRNQNQ